MAWHERATDHFAARCGEADVAAAEDVLRELEWTRDELVARLPAVPDEVVDVVLHPSRIQLHLAQPALLATPPEAREVVFGRTAGRVVHLLTPRLHGDGRAAPALYARLAVLASSPALAGVRGLPARARSLWLVEGAAQWLAGRTGVLRPAIARRLRAGGRPAFPPGPRDAALFGAPAVELVARDRGPEAVLALLADPEAVPDLGEVWPRHLERVAGR